VNIFKAWSLFRRFNNVQQEVTNMQTQAGKPWYTSLTLVANAAMALITAFTPELSTLIASHPKVALIVAAVTNILLRFRTDKPVA
jgi:hypothetical protein